MSGRQVSLTNKKVRGIPRRLRALREWSDSFEGYFPELSDDDRYYNIKIPVLSGLVQGRYATKAIKSFCAQCLIDAAINLYHARPEHLVGKVRITVVISLPAMFFSEICLYLSEEYFNAHTRVDFDGTLGQKQITPAQSLVRDWGLTLPDDFFELGFVQVFRDDDSLVSNQYWYLGEVNNK